MMLFMTMIWLTITSFVLEILGLSLAFIEIKFPLIADKIENYIDSLEDKFKNLGNQKSKSSIFETSLTISIFNIFIFGSWWILGKYSNLISPPNFHWGIWIIMLIILLFSLSVIFLILLSDFIDFLNKFSNEKAIGTLGFLIGSAGVLIEIFQMF